MLDYSARHVLAEIVMGSILHYRTELNVPPFVQELKGKYVETRVHMA